MPELVKRAKDDARFVVLGLQRSPTRDDVVAEPLSVEGAVQLEEDEWQYLLGSETDIRTAKGSWPALARLGA